MSITIDLTRALSLGYKSGDADAAEEYVQRCMHREGTLREKIEGARWLMTSCISYMYRQEKSSGTSEGVLRGEVTIDRVTVELTFASDAKKLAKELCQAQARLQTMPADSTIRVPLQPTEPWLAFVL